MGRLDVEFGEAAAASRSACLAKPGDPVGPAGCYRQADGDHDDRTGVRASGFRDSEEGSRTRVGRAAKPPPPDDGESKSSDADRQPDDVGRDVEERLHGPRSASPAAHQGGGLREGVRTLGFRRGREPRGRPSDPLMWPFAGSVAPPIQPRTASPNAVDTKARPNAILTDGSPGHSTQPPAGTAGPSKARTAQNHDIEPRTATRNRPNRSARCCRLSVLEYTVTAALACVF